MESSLRSRESFDCFLFEQHSLTVNDDSNTKCACPGCATRCCMRFTDLTLIRRLTVIPHGPHPPPFELWAEEDESDAKKILKALDIVWCEGKEEDDEGKARRMRLGGEKGREVWAIREERNWAFLKVVCLRRSFICHDLQLRVQCHRYRHTLILISRRLWLSSLNISRSSNDLEIETLPMSVQP